jgi:hypothetical protein
MLPCAVKREADPIQTAPPLALLLALALLLTKETLVTLTV